MNMKKFINIALATAAVAFLSACDLELTPKGQLSYDPEKIITNETDLVGFEAGVLAQFRGLDYGVFDWVSDVQMDEFNACADYGNVGGGVHRSDADLNAGNYDTRDNWSGPYSAIKNFNIFIEGAQSVPSGLEARAAVARGYAYLGRAFAYLHMARAFGKPYGSTSSTDLCVPLVLVYNQSERPARATVQAVYGQIKTDLDSAAVLLADVKGEARAQKPTIDAVNAVYARYYIDIHDNAKAAEYAMKVINTGNYALASTVDELVKESVEDNGTEPILQFYASLTEGIGSHSYYTGMSNNEEYGLYYRPYYIPTKALVDSYTEGTDIRKAVWFDNSNYYVYLANNWLKGDFYVFTKYIGNPELRSSTTPNSANAVKPLMISEMYLIAAEGYFGAGNTAEAKKVLNELQEKRGAIATEATAETIHREWFRETPGEGLRMSCLKRWGEGFSTRTAQAGALAALAVMTGSDFDGKSLPASDYHYQWPVPAYDMQINKNLVQNEGYVAE